MVYLVNLETKNLIDFAIGGGGPIDLSSITKFCMIVTEQNSATIIIVLVSLYLSTVKNKHKKLRCLLHMFSRRWSRLSSLRRRTPFGGGERGVIASRVTGLMKMNVSDRNTGHRKSIRSILSRGYFTRDTFHLGSVSCRALR
jgi:hypothetical protein